MTDSDAGARRPDAGAAMAATARSAPGQLTVSATVPADLVQLSVVRGLAATLGVALDFDLDTIADLRMAVDEMSSILITRSVAGGDVRLTFAAAGDRIDVSGQVTVSAADEIDRTSFGWAVLSALVVDLGASVERGDDGADTLAVQLTVVADRGGS